MIKNYPFSVILNTENNPYYTYSGGKKALNYDPNDSNAVMNRITSQLDEAISYIEYVYTYQKMMYDNFNNELKQTDNTTLEEIFAKQYNLFNKETEQKQNNESVQLKNLKNDANNLVEELKAAQRKFHADFIAATEKIVQATSKKQLQQYSLQVQNEANKIETLMRTSFEKFKEDNDSMLKRFSRIQSSKKEALNIQINQGKLTVQFENKNKTGEKKEERERQKAIKGLLESYFNILKTIKEKGGTRSFAQSSTFRNNNKELWEEYQKLRERMELTEDTKTEQALIRSIYSRDSLREIYHLFNEAVFSDGTSESNIMIQAKDYGEALVQASAFFSEEVLVEGIREYLQAALNKKGGTARSFVVSGLTRIQFADLPLANEKQKIISELYNRRDAIDLSLNEFFRKNRVLDKVDSYIAVDFEHTNYSNKYILAFSNKLYNDLSNLTILGGQEKNLLSETGEEIKARGTNLINTYDLIAQLGHLSDDFIFTVLNKSQASILSSEIDGTSLEKWLSTFIQEIAFNPASFVQTVRKELGEAYDNANIIYIFNAGATIQPIYKILENLINFLRNSSVNLQSCISTKIQYDNSNPNSLLQLVEGEKYQETSVKNPSETRYTRDAWEVVANTVARNTLFSIHLDLLNLQRII